MLNNSLNTVIKCVFNEVNFNIKIKNSLTFINIFISKK